VYILRNQFAGEVLRNQVLALGSILDMLDTRAAEVKAALAGTDSDFEDAVQRICAEDNGADVIVTRDKDGFVNATIPVMTPAEFLLKFNNVP
jgi:predicted nucleic acid-binding protein